MIATPPVSTPAHCSIPAFVAHYKVRAYGMTVAKSTRQASIEKGKYHFESQIKSDIIFYKDKMAYNSFGVIKGDRIIPDHFTYSRQRKDQKSDIRFDWPKMIAHAMKNGDKKDVKIVPGTQDFVSSQLLLRELLEKGQRKDLNFKLVKSNKLQTYHFTVLGEPEIRSQLGSIKTIELQRIDGPRTSQFWLAPKYGYLLIQSIQEKNGSRQAKVYITDYKPEKACLF